MLIKHKTFTKPIFGARLRYILREEALNKNGEGGFILKQIIRGNSIEEFEKFFLENEKYRKISRKDSVRIREYYLSFNPEDSHVLNSEILLDISRNFMKRFDPLTPGIAVPHYDKNHIHIHVLLAGIQYKTGKGNDKNNKAFSEFKKAIESYHIQKYPQIKHSIVQTKNRKRSLAKQNDREYRTKQRTGSSRKEELKKEIELTIHKSKSLQHLKQLLQEKEIGYYHSSSSRQGVIFQGKKYRFETLGLSPLIKELSKEKILASELEKEDKGVSKLMK